MKYIKNLIIHYNQYDKIEKDIEKIEIKDFFILPIIKNLIVDVKLFEKNLDLLLRIKKINLPKIFADSYSYYSFFENKRFIKFESEVANYPSSSFEYAKEILEKPWNDSTIKPKIDSELVKKAHDSIFNNVHYTYEYIERFNEVYFNSDYQTSKKIEKTLGLTLNRVNNSYNFFEKFYSKKHPNTPWIEGEDSIFKNNPENFINYVYQIYQNEIPSERIFNKIFEFNNLNVIFNIYIIYEDFIVLDSKLNDKFLNTIKGDKKIYADYTLIKIEKEFKKENYYIPDEKLLFNNDIFLIKFLELLIPIYNKKMSNQEKQKFNEFIEKAEDHISLNGEMSYEYSKIINRRFIRGENSIIKSPTSLNNSVGTELQENVGIEYSVAILYFKNFFDSRWLELEEYILKIKDPFYVINYTYHLYRNYDVRFFRWSEGEKIILDSPPQRPVKDGIVEGLSISTPQVIYAKFVIEDVWPEYEEIVKDVNGIVEYAIHVLDVRWTEKEKIINDYIHPEEYIEESLINPRQEYRRYFAIQ